jgi:integrase
VNKRAYTLPNGKRTFRSTKLRARKAAEEFCRRLEYASRESSAGRLTESRARELISEIVEHATGEPLQNYTVEGWLGEWLQGKKATTTGATYEKYENVINGFLASIGNRAKLNIDQIALRDVLRWRDALILDGRTASTANDQLAIIRMAFTRARKLGYVTQNHAEAVDTLPEDKDPARQPFSIEQVQAILRVADGDWKGAIMLALYTGARLQDVANMRWESVDLQNKWISFRVGKTKQRIKLPMHDALHDFLLELPAPDSGKAFLLPSLAGRGKGLSMTFARIMERAKVRGEVVRERKGDKGRNVNALTFHSFRHTLTSIMANGGIAVEVRQKFTGHASAEMNQHYTHHEIDTLRAAVSIIPRITGK